MGNLTVMDNGPEHDSPHDTPAEALDLDGIERDLAGVETALARLDAGTYWADEVTGEALPAELLAAHPTARTAHAAS